MKDLQDLVRITLSGRIGKIETLNSLDGDDTSLTMKLYKALGEGKISTDEEARKYLYGDAAVNPKYDMLKKRFKERLFNTLLYIEPRSKVKKTYFHNVYYCYKHIVIARLLMGISPTQAGRKLMEKVHNRAYQYELFDIAEQAAHSLKREYMLMGDETRYRYFSDSFEKAHQLLVAESKAEELYHSVAIHLTRFVGKKQKLEDLAQKNLEEVRILREKHDTFNVNYYAYNIELLTHQLAGDYEGALKVNLSYEKYFISKTSLYSIVKHANILSVRVACCLYLRRYEEGQLYMGQVLNMYNSGVENWFTMQEIHFLLVLNADKLEEACKIYLEVIGHTRFPVIRSLKQEIWKLFGGYLWFILKYKEEDNLLKNTFQQTERFSLGKFMNDLPTVFSKDKTGYNVALLILQVLILLERKEQVSIISRMDALKAYHYNNLKNKDTKRSFLFIKLLMLLERYDFDPKLLRVKSVNYLSKIQEETVGYEATPMRMEIIPYENIWDIILQMLERQQKEEYAGKSNL